MAANNIKIPKLVRAGESITAAWANDIRRAIIELANRAPAVKKAINQKRKPAPFTPTLKIEIVGEGEEATKKYFVRVSDGYLVDHVLPDEKSLSYIYPEGIKDELEKPVWHEIEDGQCLYLSFSVSIKGAVDVAESAPMIRVDEDDIDNEHYRPTIFTEGGGGLSMYKLLKFTLPDDVPKFEYFLIGDNVHHWRERMTFRNIEEDELDDDSMGDRRPIGDRYDKDEDCAYLKYIVQLTGEDGVSIIKPLPDGSTVDDVGYIPFRQIKDLGETSRQIKVSAEPTDGAITIRGNEASGSLTHVDCDDNSTILLEWEDGLITTVGAVSFTAGCSGSVREIS